MVKRTTKVKVWKVIGVTPSGERYKLTYTSNKAAAAREYKKQGWATSPSKTKPYIVFEPTK